MNKTAHVRNANAHRFSFGPAQWEHFMSWNRTLILNLLHRADMFRCTMHQNTQIFGNLRRLASSGPKGRFSSGPFHVLGPGYLHDVEYIRHYTGL
jgi:hypothetical protein